MSKSKYRLGVTPGEPAGIGPDICIQSADAASAIAELVYYCDPAVMLARADMLRHPITINNLNDAPYQHGVMNIYPVQTTSPVKAGSPSVDNAPYVIKTLELALADCQSQKTQAIVTGPINKSIINESGVAFSGHTEWLADKTNTPRVVMMLTGGGLRVALVTTHLPLSQVSAAITPLAVSETIKIVHDALTQQFGITSPNIMICGLNPHAGENGHLGSEEKEVIEPVIRSFQDKGMNLSGPIPADTAFTSKSLAGVDAVIAMFHDQGLPVLKHAAFGEAVNITLGLPVIRTSVDHGTAFDLAGTGRSECASFISAITAATELAANQN